MQNISLKELKKLQTTIKHLNCYSYNINNNYFEKAISKTKGSFQKKDRKSVV